MGGDTVEEPAVVGNYYSTAGEILKTLLQSTYSIDIHVIGRLVEEKDVTLILQCQSKMESVSFTTGKDSATLLLVRTGKVETGNICTGIDITLAEPDPV